MPSTTVTIMLLLILGATSTLNEAKSMATCDANQVQVQRI